MRIAMLYAFHSGDQGWSSPLSLKDAFERAGHTISDFNLFENGRSGHYADTGLREFLDCQDSFDFLLFLDYGQFLSPLFKNVHIPTIAEMGDDPQAFGNNMVKAPYFNILYSPDRRCVEKYKQAGFSCLWLTHFADPMIHMSLNIEPDKILVTSINKGRGGPIIGDFSLVEFLEYELGDYFLSDRYFHGIEHTKFMSRGLAVLQKSQFGEITRRIFEAAACGKLIVTDALDRETGIYDIFKPNEAAIYYESPDEILRIVDWLKTEQGREEALRIAENGRQIVLAGHTSDIRANQIIRAIESFMS